MLDPAECELFARTTQSSALKALFDTLKDLLEDACLEFDQDGMRLVCPDSTHIAMVHLRLDASNFEEYHCRRPTSVGINITRLFKLLKTIASSDALSIFVDANDPTRMGIRVESGERRTSTTFKIGMMDIEPIKIDLPPIECDTCLSLSSTDMQKIIRDMSSIADRVEITNTKDRLTLACSGDFCSQETVLGESNKVSPPTPAGGSGIVQGVFSLSYLVIFCKCSALCPAVEINLRNDWPIIFRYTVAALGEIKLCLSPMCDAA